MQSPHNKTEHITLTSHFGLGWIAHNSAALIGTNSLLMALSLGHSVLAARLLGPEGVGIVFLVLLTATNISLILNCSLDPSLQYHIGRRALTEGGATAVTVIFALVVGGGAALLMAVLGDRVLTLLSLGRSMRQLISVALPIIPLNMLIESLLAVCIAVDMVGYRNFIQIGRGVIEISLLFLLVGVAQRGPLGALESNLIGGFFSVALLVVLLTKRYGFDMRGARSMARSVLRFGFRQHGATILARATKRLDSYLLLYFLGSAQVGIYSAAASLAELPMMVARSIHGLLLTSVSTNRRDDAGRVTIHISRTVAMILVPCLAIYGVIVVWALPVVYGTRFTPALWPFAILLLASFCLSLYVILSGYLSGTGNPLHVTYIMSASAISNLTLSLVLIPVLGLVGNAFASSLSSLLAFWLSLHAFRKFSGLGYKNTLFADRADMAQLGRLGSLICMTARERASLFIRRGRRKCVN